MKNVNVSIIMPSLNVASYIRESIESVINQTMQEIEIICVDAGSTDGTKEILQEYAKKDKRIQLIYSDKKSYGRQMNLGVQAARGKYIGIVETDDYVKKDMFETLYLIAEAKKTDFVKADFYRFTGNTKASFSIALQRVALQEDNYNKIVNVSEHLEVFDYLMNTWCGIYRRSFLLEHHIWHNETLGASYQDNGFWFQTLMYAKRAYFHDKPFYMNRRDNPNSSVYSKQKVYCICDEYEFIRNILERNIELFDIYKYKFSNICYQNYKRNFERVSEAYKLDFIQRFAADFRILEEKGMLNQNTFEANDWKYIQSMLDNPEAYYKTVLEVRKKTYEQINTYEKVIIYGAGMVGKRVLEALLSKGKKKEDICFAVTSKEDNYAEYEGVTIYQIDELMRNRNTAGIVIAVTQKYYNEIYVTLQKKGFKNIISLPDES